METWTGRHGHGDIKQKTEAQAILLNLILLGCKFSRLAEVVTWTSANANLPAISAIFRYTTNCGLLN
jgi:hypothetical protein